MANRFPLVVDTDDGNKLKEIPEGDLLNLANSGITNLGSLSVSGELSSATISTTGNVSLGGTLTVTGATTLAALETSSISIGGENVRVPLNPDWEETDNTSIAFIRNKPDLDNIAPATLGAIGDVFVDGAAENDVLTWDGFSWQARASGGRTDGDIRTIARGALDLVTNTASGRGSFVYDDATGTFTFTPSNALIKGQQDNISELVNDSNYVNATYLDTNEYLQSGDVLGFGRITGTVVSGQVQLTFDDSGLLTIESDTLQTVTDRGASTTNSIEADAFTQTPTSTTTNTMRDLELENLTVVSSITGTLATSITLTSGNISTSTGNISGNNITASGNITTGGNIIGAVNISNTTGDLELGVPSGSRVDVTSGRLRLGTVTLPPSSPEIGELYFDGSSFYAYVNDNGSGSAGAVTFPAFYSALGLQLPAFEEDNLPTGNNEGMLIWNLTQSRVDVYNGTSWVAV